MGQGTNYKPKQVKGAGAHRIANQVTFEKLRPKMFSETDKKFLVLF